MKKRFKMAAYLINKGYEGQTLAEMSKKDLYHLFLMELKLDRQLLDVEYVSVTDETEVIESLAA